jgi:hypothetical protein
MKNHNRTQQFEKKAKKKKYQYGMKKKRKRKRKKYDQNVCERRSERHEFLSFFLSLYHSHVSVRQWIIHVPLCFNGQDGHIGAVVTMSLRNCTFH